MSLTRRDLMESMDLPLVNMSEPDMLRIFYQDGTYTDVRPNKMWKPEKFQKVVLPLTDEEKLEKMQG